VIEKSDFLSCSGKPGQWVSKSAGEFGSFIFAPEWINLAGNKIRNGSKV
jgi:hypothetical protein